MFWEGFESWEKFNPGGLPGGGVEDRIKGIDEKIDGNILNDTASER